MKKLCIVVAVLALTMFCAGGAVAGEYYVYCANGKIEGDSRTPQQMKSARGSGTYMMSEFDFKTDADKCAKQLGGIGGKCPKR